MKKINYKMMKATYNLSLTGLFIAMAYLLPFLFGNVDVLGQMWLPMHIPILLCAFLVGWQYAAVAGITVPLLRTLTGLRPVLPIAVSMTFELAAYGIFAGLLYALLAKKMDRLVAVYISLITAMIGGRIVWGIAMIPISQLFNHPAVNNYGLSAFWADGFVGAIAGIVLQLLVIPPIVIAVEQYKKNNGMKFYDAN